MHPYVLCSIIYNNHDVEATCVPTDRRLNKEDVHVHSGILLNHKKERNLNICDNMEGRSRGVQPAAHRPHVAQAQHKIVNLLKTL